jgi:putative ABC transport system permease protein
MHLTDDHIAYIRKDLYYRGLVLDSLQEEMLDHICTAVEAEMEKDVRFIDAYHHILKTFGSTGGLRNVQTETLRYENLKPRIMLRNYFTIAWRNLRRHTFYTAINVIGLAVGLATCLVMVLFITDELSYDKHWDKADRIYRVEAEVAIGSNRFKMNYRSAIEGQTMVQDFPEVESYVRFRQMGTYLVKPEGAADNSKEVHVIWADSTFFKIFSVPVLEGSAAKALSEPASIAISRRTAEKYFPGTSAMGKVMVLDNKYHAKVTAVFENIPAASHFHFDIIVSMLGEWPIAQQARSTQWLTENFQNYVLLREKADGQALQAKLRGFVERHVGPELFQVFGKDFTMEKFRAEGNMYDMYLRPLKDIHLYSDVRGEFEPNGNITYVYLFSIIAAFVLIIACINFMNLATARSGSRAKEVGVRKVMGSLRSHLMRQFLTESVLITLAAVVLSVVLAALFLPVFNHLSSKALALPVWNPLFYAILLAVSVMVGVMAGVYPAFFLSAFKPVNVLKGRGQAVSRSGFIRSTLVVFQFVISVFLIIGALTVNQQMDYIQTKKLGFEKDQVIIVHDGYALRPNNVQAFKTECLKSSALESGTISGYIPVEADYSWRSHAPFWREGTDPRATENLVTLEEWHGDYDYVRTFKLNVVKGRDFSTQFVSDSSGIIVNQQAAHMLGLGEDPVGKRILTFSNLSDIDVDHSRIYTVVGIVEDFHFSSMKQTIKPLALTLGTTDGSVSFRFKPNRTTEAIQAIETVWNKLAMGQPFQYSFLDEDFEKTFRAEQRLGRIFVIFAGLAIFIACLGLFALSAFTAEQRTKEIGIRKVMGASVSSIVLLLSRDFGKLVLIAFVISAPLAWYAADWWLQSYTYKTEIGVAIFLVAGAVAFLIALLTMSYQSIRAAATNPVDSLRTE